MASKSKSFRPQLESLEDRLVPSSSPIAPAIVSVEVNGGPIQAIDHNGNTPQLAGQNSVVEQLLVRFNEPVTLAKGAFSIKNLASQVKCYSGEALNTLPVSVTASPVAGDTSMYILTFSGTGATVHDNSTDGGMGNICTTIKDGFYQLATDGRKVHADDGQTAASNKADFWALYGAGNADDMVISKSASLVGSEITVASAGFQDFETAYGSKSDPGNGSAYNAAYDSNLDGRIDDTDLAAIKLTYDTDWAF